MALQTLQPGVPEIANRRFRILRILLGSFYQHLPAGKVERQQKVVAMALGSLLLVAASLKAYAFVTESIQPLFYVLSPKWQIVVMEGEILLGLWLLSGFSRQLALLVALVTFVTFSAINFFLGSLGRPSCGCFGNVQVNPWYVFILDVSAIISIVYSRVWERIPASARGFRLFVPLCCLTIGLALLLALSRGYFDRSFAGFLAVLRGEKIEVQPAVSFLGKIPKGTVQEFSVNITNHGKDPVRVLGGTADCKCRVVQDLPLALGPGETRKITVFAPFGGNPGPVQKPFRFFTDDPASPYVYAWVSGYVVEENAQ